MKEKTKFTDQAVMYKNMSAYFIFFLLFILGIFLYGVIQPFVMILFLSAVVAVVTYPIYEYFYKILKGRASSASVITCFLVMFAIVIPAIIFVVVLVGQLTETYDTIRSQINRVDFIQLMSWKKGNFFYDMLGSWSDEIELFVRSNTSTLVNGFTDLTKYISTVAAEQSFLFFKGIGLTLYNLLMMFFILYFYYRDGKKIVKQIMILSPLPIAQEKLIYKRFIEISKATLVGNFFTALSQGFVAFIGFYIAGVPSSVFWATATAVFSLVPMVGTGLVWVPIGVAFLITGQIFWGLFILIWGFLLIGTIDNVVRVIFIGGSVKMNALLTFIAVFGGIIAYGLVGVVFGPILLVMFLTVLNVYEFEFASVLKNAYPEKDYEDSSSDKKQSLLSDVFVKEEANPVFSKVLKRKK